MKLCEINFQTVGMYGSVLEAVNAMLQKSQKRLKDVDDVGILVSYDDDAKSEDGKKFRFSVVEYDPDNFNNAYNIVDFNDLLKFESDLVVAKFYEGLVLRDGTEFFDKSRV